MTLHIDRGVAGKWVNSTTGNCRIMEMYGKVAIIGMSLGAAIMLSAVLVLTFPQTTHAQTLDQAVNTLLADNCTVLGGSAGRQTFYGANLDDRCQTPNIASSAVTGGGGATSQTSGGSLGVARRLKTAKGEEGEGASSDTSVSLGQGLSLFVSGNYEALNKDVTTFEDGFDSDIAGLTVGVDRAFNEWLVAGVAFNYTRTDGDFDGGGGFDTDSYGGIVFASFAPATGFFADIVAGYSRKDFSASRPVSFTTDQLINNASGTASSDTDGDEYTARVLLGYDHAIGRFTIGPRVGVNYTRTEIDGFAETGGTGLELVYDDQSVDSVQSVLGVQGSMAISTSFGVLVPQVNVDYIHEFSDDQRSIVVRFAEDLRAVPTKFTFNNDDPVRDYANIGLGIVAVLPNGLQPFANFQTIVGNGDYQSYAGNIGLRLEF